jgi:hypothetical protein
MLRTQARGCAAARRGVALDQRPAFVLVGTRATPTALRQETHFEMKADDLTMITMACHSLPRCPRQRGYTDDWWARGWVTTPEKGPPPSAASLRCRADIPEPAGRHGCRGLHSASEQPCDTSKWWRRLFGNSLQRQCGCGYRSTLFIGCFSTRSVAAVHLSGGTGCGSDASLFATCQ